MTQTVFELQFIADVLVRRRRRRFVSIGQLLLLFLVRRAALLDVLDTGCGLRLTGAGPAAAGVTDQLTTD